MQVVPERCVRQDAHDVPLDPVVTPERVVETSAERGEEGIDWETLCEEQRRAISVLDRLYAEESDDA